MRVHTAEREYKGALRLRTPSVIEITPDFDIRTARTADTTLAVLRHDLVEGAVRTGSRWTLGLPIGAAAGVLAVPATSIFVDDDELQSWRWIPPAIVLGTAAGGVVGSFVKTWTPLDGLTVGAGISR